MIEERDYENDGENMVFDGEKEMRRFVRGPLILSLIGLICSVFYGAGGIIAMISLVLSSKRLKMKNSDSLRWAKVISLVTLVISAAYFLAVIAAIIYGDYEIKNLVEETAFI
ncbi:MAG: hypothetical protein J5836_00165 [Clostridia bacterium]|nr:hypothetical protein [Clostridia bacterium]